jgi:hypothetical protein
MHALIKLLRRWRCRHEAVDQRTGRCATCDKQILCDWEDA